MVRFPKGIWWMILVALVLYFVLAVLGDIKSVVGGLRGFSFWVLFVILMLSLVNYNIRFIKWDYLLRRCSIGLSRWASYSVFMAGLAGTCSPGKSGELIKPMLISELFGVEIQKTIPVFFFERLTDLIALIFLSFLGIFAGRKDFIPIIVLAGFLIILLFFFSSPTFWKLIFGIFDKKPQKGLFKLIYDISINIQIFWDLKILFVTLILSVVSWFAEGVGYYLVFKGMNSSSGSLAFLESIFIYSASTVFGAVTFIPGGLGVTDGSLTALAISAGISTSSAVLSTIIIRACTLWFALFIGIIFFLYIQKGLKNKVKGDEL